MGPRGDLVVCGSPSVLHDPSANRETLAELVDSGRLRPVVDRTFPIADTVAAFDHLATRRARGQVVILP